MRNLNLVVTSDTAIAHLAGALGVSVWVALSSACDWRWLEEREDSPWYPTMRLFRQRRLGDWDELFRRIAAELAAVSSGDAARLRPAAVPMRIQSRRTRTRVEEGNMQVSLINLQRRKDRLDAFLRVNATIAQVRAMSRPSTAPRSAKRTCSATG